MSLLELKQAASRLSKHERDEFYAYLISLRRKMSLPKAHKNILDARLKNYRRGKSRPITHEELMRRLRTP